MDRKIKGINPIRYVLITPVKNEEKYIGITIESVLAQTILPIRWIIVNDGSTDGTKEIIKRYSDQYQFIQLHNLYKQTNRDFASQVYATNAGYHEIGHLKFDYIGILDADITFKPDYYEIMIKKLIENKNLGIVGGAILHNTGKKYQKDARKTNHVGGGIQFFRRDCYDKIGGYTPLIYGGQDVVIEVRARMLGWEVKAFHEVEALHHKPMGTGNAGIITAKYRQGIMEYSIGSHPLFMMMKCLRRVNEQPYVIGSILRLYAFFLCYLRRKKRNVSKEYIRYLQKEQIDRIKSKLTKKLIP